MSLKGIFNPNRSKGVYPEFYDYKTLLDECTSKMVQELLAEFKNNDIDFTGKFSSYNLHFECYSLLFSYLDVFLFKMKHVRRTDIVKYLLAEIERIFSDRLINVMNMDVRLDEFIKNRYSNYSKVAMNKSKNYGQFTYDTVLIY